MPITRQIRFWRVFVSVGISSADRTGQGHTGRYGKGVRGNQSKNRFAL